ncbi:hypothetical protein P5V15_000138 [Pogonomyrmex californicus]
MPIADGTLVSESTAATHHASLATVMLRFVDRLSGKRRHVRRSSGPGGAVHAAEETQEGKVNDRGCETDGILIEEISSSVAKSKAFCDDSGGIATRHHYRSPPYLHHLRYRSHRHPSSHRRYRHRRDDANNNSDSGDDQMDENDVNDDDDERDNDEDGDDDDDDDDDGSDGNNDGDHNGDNDNDEGDGNDDNDDDNDDDDNNDSKMCLKRLHPRLHRFYDQRSCRNGDVDAEVNVDHIEVHRTETTTVHPLVRTSPITTTAATTVANSSVVTAMARGCKIPPYITTILFLSYTLFGIADACSSRSTPKPRPPASTDRPNVTFHMYTCPQDYAEWYCLNGATCFTVKIVDSLLYNCLCAHGFIGQRCEFKDLDGSYLPSRQRVMLETASIAGGATIAVFLVVIICITAYIHCKRKQKELRSSNNCVDTVDGPGRDPELRPFSNRSRSLMSFMAKNSNNSATIEQTRMPNWNCPEESMKMASISENKYSSQ